MSTEPTRRAVLTAGLVGAGLVGLSGLAGCTGDDQPKSGPSTRQGPDHDTVVTAAVERPLAAGPGSPATPLPLVVAADAMAGPARASRVSRAERTTSRTRSRAPVGW